jgi:signal transduction histidine kinase/DNA-binding response OmpR family regulator
MRLPRLPDGALRLMAPSRTVMWMIACSSAAAAFVAVCLIALVAIHAATERRAENAASATATLASYDAAQTFGQYDRALQAIVARVQSPDSSSLSEAARNLILFDRATSLPGLAFVNVLDEDGRVVNSPEAAGMGSTWQGRDYFAAHRTNPSLGTFIGRLFGQEDYAGVTISRRLSHPDGTFAGVVVAGLRLKYLRELFERLPLGPHGSITLQRNDGTILMRRPYDRNDVGRIAASQSLVQSDDHIAERQIGALPLVLRVAVPGEDQADNASRWIAGLLDICVVIAVISGVLVLALHREIKRRDAAERDNRNKSDYLTMVSHELRTPLHSILGNADLLRADSSMDADNRRHLAAIVGGGHHLRNVLDRVLNHLQIETRIPTPRMGRVDLVAMVDDCCIIVESEIAARGLGIHYGFKVDAPEQFITDGDLLRQVLLNLISNAIKFTERGNVSIEIGGTDERITIEVKDTGCGIPHDQRHKLFQQGERLGAERTSVPGHGIGLAITKRLVQSMGGDIGYRENAPQGSIFWIGLSAGTTMDAPAQATASGTAKTAPLSILLVDDVSDSRELACASLMDHGHTVTEARDGAQAAEFAARQNFDVVLLDIDGISGVEAANLLRKTPGKRSPLPIVAIVSDALDQRIIAGRSLGIMHHLVKPFSAHELLAMVDRVARQHSTRSADADASILAPAKICIAFDDLQQRLGVLTRKVEWLLAALRHLDGTESDTAAGELAREVASLAKLFGLGPLADAAGRFADAAALNSPVAGDLAHALETAAHSCLPELRELAVSSTI